MKKLVMICALLTGSLLGVKAEADPNFYVYLCFGQSNMEGNAAAENVDKINIDKRFKMLATTNFDNPKRTMGLWYTPTPPIVSPVGGLGMADYFGRTMVAALPQEVRIGVLAVAMGGSPIEMFDKTLYKQKLADNPNEWWAQLANRYYGGNPYQRLVDMGKKAQESGVIKGILLHQGCSNNGDPNWPNRVKKIYNDLLKDLGLTAADVPLFVGETLQQDQGGACYGHNTVVAKMPQVVPTSYVIHSNGCPGNNKDPWHFSAAGYRTMGKRYAYEALRVMGHETKMDENYQMASSLKSFFTPKSYIQHFKAEPSSVVVLKLWCTFADGHVEDLTSEATFTSTDFRVMYGKVKMPADGSGGKVTATYTDFFGTEHNVTIAIDGNDETGITTTTTDNASHHNDAVYNLQGVLVGTRSTLSQLSKGIYIINGKKILLN